MEQLRDVVLLVAVVAAAASAARRIGLLGPIVLVVVGTALSYVPGFPAYDLPPELVLVVILPPLLHVAAVQTSVPAFRTNLRSILLLAVGLVLVTTVAVGLVLHALVPSIPLAACLAFGAVVAPPDAVAATAIARRIGLPRRLVTILEGESLLNDATALTALRVAAAAATGTATTLPAAVWTFVVAALGGVLVGYAVSLLVTWLHRRTDDALLDNTLSLLTPFLAFVAAEAVDVSGVHASGVVAVVVCGLRVGHLMPELMSAGSRLQTTAFWKVTEFLLQGVVFLLLGLQIRGLLADLTVATSTVVATSAAVLATVILVRFAWVFPATYVARLVPRVRRGDPAPPPAYPAVLSWAGMRGVVSLAAAFTLPASLPERDLLLWLTVVVIVGTLVGQGLTLPTVARRLGVRPDDTTADILAEAQVQQEAAAAARQLLDAATPSLPLAVVERLGLRTEQRVNAVWERLGDQSRETPAHAYRRVRRAMLDQERAVFRRARDAGRIDEDVLVRVQRDLDLEESLLLDQEKT